MTEMNAEDRLKAISIVIHHWIKEENKIKIYQALSRIVRHMSISKRFDSLYIEMFRQYNDHHLINANKIRQELISLATTMVDENIKTPCDVCNEHLMIFTDFKSGDNDQWFDDFDHRLFSFCTKCNVQSMHYF